MTEQTSRSTEHRQGPAQSRETLTARVQALVENARVAVDRRGNATRPKSRRQPLSLPSPDSQSVEEMREFQSLQRVFREMGLSYRRYRRHSRTAPVPGVRDAAYNFRAEPSLTSLVAVAACLDKLDLLN
jgi:hypothetical protein